MSDRSSNRIFTQHHVWLLPQDDEYLLGITQFAQQQLGDIVFVELPQLGKVTQAGEACLVVESVKSASDVICPVNGKITQVNERLEGEPELINESPYEDGWLVRIKADKNSTIERKMFQDEYNAMVLENS